MTAQKTELESLQETVMEMEDGFREKHGNWKSSYYSAILTVCGLILATVTILELNKTVMLLVMLLAGSCVISCVLNIMLTVQFYEHLGYSPIKIKKLKDFDEYYAHYASSKDGYEAKASGRKSRDKWIKFSFFTAITALCVSPTFDNLVDLALPYLPLCGG